MSTYRLLGGPAGWDPRPDDGLDGLALVDGALVLAGSAGGGTAPSLPDLLAWSARDRTWWLGGSFGVRRWGPCDEVPGAPWPLRRPVLALAAGDGLLVVLLRNGRGTVLILDSRTGFQYGEADVPGATGVAVVDGAVAVVDSRGRVAHLDRSGLVCRTEETCLPPTRALPRPAAAGAHAIADAAGKPVAYHVPGHGWVDPDGRPVDPPTESWAAEDTVGTYRSLPLDSTVPACRWHRVRVDADVPSGTSVRVAVATSDAPPDDHEPHAVDWFDIGAGVTDALLRTPPGRWAFLRVRLAGDSRRTPVLHGIRLELPRRTGVDDLPAVFSEDPRARDFTERFVGLFDAWLEDVDDVLDRRAALLDPAALPDDALGWLGGLIGLGFEAEMPVSRRRELLAAAPDLYRRRGTPQGLLDTVRIALGVSATVEEPARQRPWGAVGSSRLGAVRLFGRSDARFRLGTSRLGRAPMVAQGDPDLDALRAGTHRVRVHLPPVTDDGATVDTPLVARVVRSQAPAHLVTTVAAPSGTGYAAGTARVGVDTVLTVPDPAVLGGATRDDSPERRSAAARTVLSRHGVVAPGRRKPPQLVGTAGDWRVGGTDESTHEGRHHGRQGAR
jgi:phage tail-like protein